MAEMKIGYILKINKEIKPGVERFRFREASFTRRISSRGDRVYSKILQFPAEYEDVAFTTKMMKENPNIIIVSEPFLLDDELREKVTRWVEWANQADPGEYDPFATIN